MKNVRIDIKSSNGPVQTQFTIFIIWFVAFVCSIIWYMATRNDLALNTVLVLVILIGAIMLIDTARTMYYAVQSRKWPKTTFVVKSARVSSSIQSSNSASGFYAYFELEYEVDENKYDLSNNEFNLKRHSSAESAEEFIKRVRAGEFGNELYYNPDNPAQSFLKPGIKPRQMLPIIVGAGIIIVAYLTFIGKIDWR